MHVEGLAGGGEFHLGFGAFPVHELGVVGEAGLFQVLEAGGVPVVEEGDAFLHDVVGGPAFGVDDVGALEGFVHGEGFLEGAA